MEEIQTQTNEFHTQSFNTNTQQLSKFQPIVESDYSHREILKSKIKQYEQKIKEQDKLIQRQRKQNQHLKNQLKTLNANLTTVIEKVNPKEKKNKEVDEAKKDNVTKKQLEITLKQNAAYQKQLITLKAKLQAYGAQRIQKMENQIKEKDHRIEEMNIKIKVLQKSDKIYHNTDMNKINEQLVAKINGLNEEITFMKKKLADQKKSEQIVQKNLKKKHEYAIFLENKVKQRETSTSRDFDKEKKEQVPDESENKRYKELMDSMQHSKTTLQKKYKIEIDLLKGRIRTLEEEQLDFKQKLSNKDKQINILNFKLNQVKRKGGPMLEPLEKMRKSLDVTQMNFERRKEYKGLMNISQTNRKFDDSTQLGIEKNYRITKMVFQFTEQFIESLTTQYEFQDGSKKIINSFQIEHDLMKNKMSKVEIEFEGYEYISQFQGLCNKHIEFMRIVSSRGNQYNIGSDKNLAKCKKFSFDIRTHQKPVAVMGIIDHKKMINDKFSDVLISFGLQIKKKQVVLGKQPSVVNVINKVADYKKENKTAYEQNDKNFV